MWHLLPWRRQVVIVTALAVLLAWAADAAVEWAYGQPAPLLKFISVFAMVITIGVAGVASLTWRHVWRKFPVVARKTFPDLNGTWEGTIVGFDPTMNKPFPPIFATIWIRQTLFSLSIKLVSPDSTSYSAHFVLEADHNAGRFRVWYSYDNQPRAEFAHRSARHEGVAWLEMDINNDPNHLTGQYYSSRRTNGDLAFRRPAQLTFASVGSKDTFEPACSE